MALRNIRINGDPILRKNSKEVKEITERTAELIDDMIESLAEFNGVGLAAVQVGVLKRICVIHISPEDAGISPAGEEGDSAETGGAEIGGAETGGAEGGCEEGDVAEGGVRAEKGTEEESAAQQASFCGGGGDVCSEETAGVVSEEETDGAGVRGASTRGEVVEGASTGGAGVGGTSTGGAGVGGTSTGGEVVRGTIAAAAGTSTDSDETREYAVHTDDKDIVLINPEITIVGDETQTGNEGCLSVPHKWGTVTRPMRIRLKAYDRNLKPYELAAEGLLARAICHEVDHMDGKMYIDIVEGPLRSDEDNADVEQD